MMRKVGMVVMAIGVMVAFRNVNTPVGAPTFQCGPYDPLDICCMVKPERCGLRDGRDVRRFADIQDIGK